MVFPQDVRKPLQHDAVVSFPFYLPILFHYIEKFNTPALLESGVGTSLINFTAKVQRPQRIQQRLSYQRYFSILTAFTAMDGGGSKQ